MRDGQRERENSNSEKAGIRALYRALIPAFSLRQPPFGGFDSPPLLCKNETAGRRPAVYGGRERERERERERADRETIRTMKRRVYVPSIGHVSLLFSTTAAAVSTAGGLDRERERDLIEIERERETRVIAVDVVEFLHQLLRALLRDLFTQWVCVCV